MQTLQADISKGFRAAFLMDCLNRTND